MTEMRRNSYGFLRPIPEIPEDLPEWEKEVLADTTRILTWEEILSMSSRSARLLGEQESMAQELVSAHLNELYYRIPLSESGRIAGLALHRANMWSRT